MVVPASYSSSFIASAVVLGLILNAAVLCYGGRTSTYMRPTEFNRDMPVDSPAYYVPPGKNTPQQASFLLSCFMFSLSVCPLIYILNLVDCSEKEKTPLTYLVVFFFSSSSFHVGSWTLASPLLPVICHYIYGTLLFYNLSYWGTLHGLTTYDLPTSYHLIM